MIEDGNIDDFALDDKVPLHLYRPDPKSRWRLPLSPDEDFLALVTSTATGPKYNEFLNSTTYLKLRRDFTGVNLDVYFIPVSEEINLFNHSCVLFSSNDCDKKPGCQYNTTHKKCISIYDDNHCTGMEKELCEDMTGCVFQNGYCLLDPSTYDPAKIDLKKKKPKAKKQSGNPQTLLRELLQQHQLTRLDVRGDGNCYFRSISHFIYGNEYDHMRVRREIVDWMLYTYNKLDEYNNPDYNNMFEVGINDGMIQNNDEWTKFVVTTNDKDILFQKYLEIMSTPGVFVESDFEILATHYTYNILINIYTYTNRPNEVIRTIPDNTGRGRYVQEPNGRRVINLLNIRQAHYNVLI